MAWAEWSDCGIAVLATIDGIHYASTVMAANRSLEATLRRSEYRERELPRASEPNARGPHGHPWTAQTGRPPREPGTAPYRPETAA